MIRGSIPFLALTGWSSSGSETVPWVKLKRNHKNKSHKARGKISINSLDIVQDLLILFLIMSAVGMNPCVTELRLDGVLTASEFIHSPVAF